ncbi:hypothetical protein WMY93_033151 [Mugilogobius chulae]|uniref:Uncharacterized protein n=1 Tax=Mugilogobius chulae TaxID=88201 RepID=A0AAW0MKZ8_9GOBI
MPFYRSNRQEYCSCWTIKPLQRRTTRHLQDTCGPTYAATSFHLPKDLDGKAASEFSVLVCHCERTCLLVPQHKLGDCGIGLTRCSFDVRVCERDSRKKPDTHFSHPRFWC